VERRPDAEKRLYGDRSLPLIVTFISSIGSLDKALKLRSEIAPRPRAEDRADGGAERTMMRLPWQQMT